VRKISRIPQPVAFKVDMLFVDHNGGLRYVEGKIPQQRPATFWKGLPVHKQTCPNLPVGADFVLMLMSRQRRNDVLNDLLDWYPCWLSDKGRMGAFFACWWKIGSAVLHGFLDLAERIGEIVGKFRGAK
jgi:hypothetical protein